MASRKKKETRTWVLITLIFILLLAMTIFRVDRIIPGAAQEATSSILMD